MADTATPAFVSSGADLVNMAPADLFSDVSDSGDTGTDAAIETAADDTSIDTGADAPVETETIDAPGSLEDADATTGDDTGDETQLTAAPKTSATPAEELPEGVIRGKDNNGKPGLFVQEDRWKSIYPNHQLVQQVSELMGEPATADSIGLRQEAYVAQERLYNDLTSGDPAAQGAVLDFFLDEMARSREQGEIGADASIPFAESVYAKLRDKAPDGYAQLRLTAARDLLQEMFELAGQTQDESLGLSAQHVARALAGIGKDVSDLAQIRSITGRMQIPFLSKAEIAGLGRGESQNSRLLAENQNLRTQLQGRQTNTQAAQFDEWATGTTQSVNKAILDDAVTPALASVADAWKLFPDDYQRLIVDPLHRDVAKNLKGNQALQETIRRLDQQARRAVSKQKRDEIGQQIKQAYTHRAKFAADAAKKPILEFAAKWLKEQADRNHTRRQGAQTRTATTGTASPVQRNVLPADMPKMNGTYDPAIAMKQMLAVVGS